MKTPTPRAGDLYQHCKGGVYEILDEGLTLNLNLSFYEVLEDWDYQVFQTDAILESDKSPLVVVWSHYLSDVFLIYKDKPSEVSESPDLYILYMGLESGLVWVRKESDFFSLHTSGVPRFVPIGV